MNVGINFNIDNDKALFYNTYYDVVDSPDFNNAARLLKPKHGIKTIGYQNKKKCRFCNKSEPEVSFSKIAHVFPESIGNKALASLYECDFCNDKFGNTIENDYGNFFQFYHAIAGIRGKRKIPKFKSKTGTYDLEGNFIPDFELFWEPMDKGQNELCLKVISNIPFDDQKPEQNAIVFEELIPNCCPIGVFKAIVKMAITAMPFTELHLFSHTIEWLLSSPHTNIYPTKKLLVRYTMIPGFNVIKYPHFVLYRRKTDNWNKPYMIFNLTYGLFSLLIEVPRDNDKNTENILSVPFPPIPFFTSSEGYWDLSDKTLKADSKHSIELQFDSISDVTKNTTMSIKNGKRIVTTKL